MLDMMIAAQTLAKGATLVTHDRAFHGIKHLKIEDRTKMA
jgi:predicted nucleic acid-binding protein